MSGRVIGVVALGLLAGAGLTACGSTPAPAPGAFGGPPPALPMRPMTGRSDVPASATLDPARTGFRGWEIVQIQKFLMARGYDLIGANGALNSETRRAITRYQTDMRLPADGQPSQALLSEAQAFLSARQESDPAVTETAASTLLDGTRGRPSAAMPKTVKSEPDDAEAQTGTASTWVEPDF